MNRRTQSLGERSCVWRLALGLAVVLVTAMLPGRAAGATDAGELALSTERVVVFKDGYALVVKKAVGVADDAGRVHTGEVPDAAVLGTFWASAKEGRVRGMLAEWVEEAPAPIESACISMPELLRVNVGNQVKLQLKDGQEYVGVLEGVLPSAPPSEGEASEAANRILGREASERVAPPLSSWMDSNEAMRILGSQAADRAELLILAQADGERIVLPVGLVKTAAATEFITRITRAPEPAPKQKRLTFDLGEAAAGKAIELSIMYFRPGIRWIPTYRLTSDMRESGVLALQGEILNEAEDVEGAAFDLVVGVPNFRFRDTVSPLVLEQTMRRALQEAAPSVMGQQMMSNSFASRAGEWRQPSSGNDMSMGIAPELSGSDADDLFVYHLGDFSIDKGARATAFLWQDEVEFEHLYTLDLEINRMGQPEAREIDPRDRSNSPLDLLATRVWHQLKIKNESEVPWTTGSVLLLQDWLPLAQELLTYTSVGGEAMVPVTVAVGMRAEQEERETERSNKPIQWHSHSYYRVEKAGSVTIRSFRQEVSRMRVSVTVHGPALSASDGGEFINRQSLGRREYRYDSPALNPDGVVVWEFDLEPGASKTVEYTYYYYDG
jgi:hypothetical protein